MEGMNIRLKSINIMNFKNIIDSNIEFEDEQERCVTGIYGPNGSGKTAVIDTIELFKILGSKRTIKFPYYFVRKGEETSTVSYEFNYRGYKVKYDASFKINKDKIELAALFSNEKLLIYSNDKLRYSFRIDRTKDSVKEAIGFSVNGKEIGLKSFDFEKLVSNFSVAKNDSKSFIFDGLEESIKESELYNFMKCFLFDFNYYASVKMTVISIKESYGIAVRDEIPLHLDYFSNENDGIIHSNGIVIINLLGENLVPVDYIAGLEVTISQCNKILVAMLDKMMISMRVSEATTLDEKGVVCHKVTFNSIRNEVEIPLVFESEGIKKIISMATAFIAVYNNKNALVAIDELDAGIFEILLGEMVKVLYERGKGQFIFTSHNLRVLEVVDNKSIIIATMNDKNKFQKFPNVKPTNNFRNMYLRALVLDADKKYYNSIDDMEIALALRSAGKLVGK